MAAHLPVPNDVVDSTSAVADSVASTPRSDFHEDGGNYSLQPRIRFMCSFGGKILPRPHDNQLRYVGGDTRMVAVHRHSSFLSLLALLSKLSGTTDISIKYQLPSEDLDALITVTADEDVENMMEEYDRLALGQKSARLRLFLFPTDSTDSRASSISSLLDGSVKRENWFFDALNGGSASGPALERGRSEVSSIVSEVPDYLFGLDNSDEALKETAKLKHRNLVNDNYISVSDPGSPAPAASSPFCSTSSSLAPSGLQVIPDLPPVKTKPAHREPELMNNEKTVPGGYSGSPIWHYPNPAVQPMPAAVYYLSSGNASVQPVQIRAPFIQPYAVPPLQVPVGFPGVNQVYRHYEMPGRIIATDNGNPALYYGAGRNMAVVPGMVAPGGEELHGSGPESIPGRVGQGP